MTRTALYALDTLLFEYGAHAAIVSLNPDLTPDCDMAAMAPGVPILRTVV